ALALQIALGIATLLLAVPVPLAAAHQPARCSSSAQRCSPRIRCAESRVAPAFPDGAPPLARSAQFTVVRGLTAGSYDKFLEAPWILAGAAMTEIIGRGASPARR